jgi:uncharacterized protein YgiM (DUF1202 family)
MRLKHPVSPKYVRIRQPWMGYPGHKGVDYGWISIPVYIPASRENRAAAPGRVVRVNKTDTDNKGWGLQVIIQHTDKAWTTYNHFAPGTITVNVGDVVDTLDLLGRMGRTGKAPGGIHQHFELRVGGIGEQYRVDPAPYLEVDLPGKPVLPQPDPKPAVVHPGIPQVVTAHAGLNVRASRSTKGKILGTLKRKAVVMTFGHRDGFEQILYKGKTAFVSDEFLVHRNRVVNTPGSTLMLRAKPTTSSKALAALPHGTKVRIIAVDGNTDSSKWAWVITKGRKGWVHREFLK